VCAENIKALLNEYMAMACFGLAVGLLLAAKPLSLSEVIAGPAIGGLFVLAGLCYVAAAIDRRTPPRADGGGRDTPSGLK
jgi:hypothetical protein